MELNSSYVTFTIMLTCVMTMCFLIIQIFGESEIKTLIWKSKFLNKYLNGDYFNALSYAENRLYGSEIFEIIQQNNIPYSEFIILLKNYANFIRKIDKSWNGGYLDSCFYITVQHYCPVNAPADEHIASLWNSDKSGEGVLRKLNERKQD